MQLQTVLETGKKIYVESVLTLALIKPALATGFVFLSFVMETTTLIEF
jgi:hypothetical protein